jgi:exonuclease I
MRLFSEEVIPTLTNANLNIITVKDYTEIFFDVYELEINGKKYITEKIDTHNGYPVVEIPIIYKNKQTTAPFVLQKGKFEVLYNEHNTVFVSDLSDNIDLHVEQEEADLVDELIITKRENFAREIKEAKNSAKQYADNIKQQKLEEADKAIAIRKKRIDNEIADIKSDLIN